MAAEPPIYPGVGKLGLRPVFQGEVGDDCYGELIRSKFRESHVDDSLLAVSKELKTGISLSFTNEKGPFVFNLPGNQ